MKNISVCVQNLAMYNQGKLDYKWITLPCENDEIVKALKEIGINNHNDEYSIVDTVGIISDEYEGIFFLNKIAKICVELSKRYGISVSIINQIMNDFDNFEEELENGTFINTKENGMENLTSDFEIIGYTIATNNGMLEKIQYLDIESYFDFKKYGETYVINRGTNVYEDEENNLLILI